MSTSDAELETIVAVATPKGRGGVGVIRVSGSQVEGIANSILGKIPTARKATLANFKDQDKKVIDQGLALFFPKPNSFTGEDVLELHAHGGPVVLQLIFDEILTHSDVRPATAGEFSQRAFLNNKIDLVQAEAIADLIDSHSKTAARCAARSLQGEFSKKINKLVKRLVELRMFIESAIDFSDEDIEFIEQGDIVRKLLGVSADVQSIYSNAHQGCLLREGVSVVIVGLPNVGKSSLLNELAQQQIAIVTDIAGTTRDVLQQKILLDDIPLHLIDTAGICDSNDVVEKEGVQRAWQQVAQADLILFVQDASDLGNINSEKLKSQLYSYKKEEQKVVMINNKIDLISRLPGLQDKNNEMVVDLSVKKNEGLDILKDTIKKIIGFNDSNQTDYLARSRHLHALKKTSEYIENGLMQLEKNKAVELLAEDLRLAQQSMSEITGEIYL